MNLEQPFKVLIFGGSGTLGKAMAMEFAKHGWTVGVHYHQNSTQAKKTVSAIKGNGGAGFLYQADVTNPHQVKFLMQKFIQDHGHLHVAIWSVGRTISQLAVKTTSSAWQDIIQTNLTGAFHVLKEVGAIFEEQRKGAIILIGSLSGQQGTAGQTAYAGSKAGLIGLMKTAAREWGDFNIRVNVIFPGWISSPLSESYFDSVLRQTPHTLQRTPSLEHIARTVYHLALAEDTSGQVWNLDSRLW